MTKQEAKKRAYAWAAEDLQSHLDGCDGPNSALDDELGEKNAEKFRAALQEIIDSLTRRAAK